MIYWQTSFLRKPSKPPIICLLNVKSLTFDLSQVCFQGETTEATEILQFMSFECILKVDAAWILWCTWISYFSPRWALCNGQTNCQTSDLFAPSHLMPSCEICIWETLHISACMAQVRSGWIVQAGGWSDGLVADGLAEYEAMRCRQIESRSDANHRIAHQPCHCPHIANITNATIAHTMPILPTDYSKLPTLPTDCLPLLTLPLHCLQVYPWQYPFIAHIATSAIISKVSSGKWTSFTQDDISDSMHIKTTETGKNSLVQQPKMLRYVSSPH